MILERRGGRTTDLWKIMRDGSLFYKHTVEGTSTTGTSLLDTFLHKGSGWRKSGLLDNRPYFKNTSLSIPLSFSSAHPVLVHCTWPEAEIRRLARRSSDTEAFIEARHTFVQRLEKYSAPRWFLHHLESLFPPMGCPAPRNRRTVGWERLKPARSPLPPGVEARGNSGQSARIHTNKFEPRFNRSNFSESRGRTIPATDIETRLEARVGCICCVEQLVMVGD